MAFIGSAFAGVMSGVEKGYKFGGEIVKDLRLNELLKQTAQTPGEVGGGGGESTGTSTPSAGAGTPYSADGDKPTPGAPYVQEKPAPPPPGMDAFARRGKPIPTPTDDWKPPEQQTYEPYPGGKNDPNAPAAAIPTGPPGIVQRALPGFKLPWFATGTPPAAQGTVPAFVPQSVANTISSWMAGPPKSGDVRGGNVYNGVSWVPAPTGAVVPGTTAPVTPGQALPVPP